MKKITVLFARHDSIYKTITLCDVYDKNRDARSWTGGTPLIAHPPCAQWGRLRALAKKNEDEKQLAPLAVELIRKWGGVLEHPLGSTLWPHMNLPQPGSRDQLGGFTLPIDQHWFGHKARKPTYLYILGIEPRRLPPIPIKLDLPTHVIDTVRRNPGRNRWCSKTEREATPPGLAHWLVNVTRGVTWHSYIK